MTELKTQLEEMAIKHGAANASVVAVSDIHFDEELRKFCEVNYCGNYNKNWTCPPSIGDTKTVIAKAKGYTYALVFQTIGSLEDSFDIEGMEKWAKIHEKCSDSINEYIMENYTQYLPLTAGGCRICEKCAKRTDNPCRFPSKQLSSLEAYCINVADLALTCGMKYINGINTVTYFGAYLF